MYRYVYACLCVYLICLKIHVSYLQEAHIVGAILQKWSYFYRNPKHEYGVFIIQVTACITISVNVTISG